MERSAFESRRVGTAHIVIVAVLVVSASTFVKALNCGQWTPVPAQPVTGRCAYELVIDGYPQGTLVTDRAMILSEILDDLRADRSLLGETPKGMVACNSVIRIERGKLTDVSVPIAGKCLLALNLPIDVNRSRPQDLQAIPGIGERLAGRIVDYRRSNGPFQSLRDLTQVHGIGPDRLSRIAKHLTLNPED